MTTDTKPLFRLEQNPVAHDGILAILGQFGLTVGYGMIMAPSRFDLVRVDSGAIESFDGTVSDLLANAYEIRFFGAGTDAHWQRKGSGGRLVISTVEKAIAAAPVPTIAQLDRHYRMFGTADDAGKDGWSQLKAARIRPVPVPVPSAAKGKALVLTAVEHVASALHGNAVVVAERLTGIAIAEAENNER